MNYTIRELNGFTVIGQAIELTNSQRKNTHISTEFWKTFNKNLKKAYLSQSGNWVKYAFMEKKNGKLLYYCAIPKKTIVPDGFVEKQIKPQKYLVIEHVGEMEKIYSTYTKLYKNILPDTKCVPVKDAFLHFERYDYRFHWNREDSIIEIWLPITIEK